VAASPADRCSPAGATARLWWLALQVVATISPAHPGSSGHMGAHVRRCAPILDARRLLQANIGPFNPHVMHRHESGARCLTPRVSLWIHLSVLWDSCRGACQRANLTQLARWQAF
jgi:hypothetical protein